MFHLPRPKPRKASLLCPGRSSFFHRIGSLNFTLQNRLVGDIPHLVRHGPSKLGPALTRGENWTVRFFYPSRIHHILYNVYGSLLVLLLCLCKSLQRTLFLFANRCISEKRVQRYRLLRYPPNVLAIIFQKKMDNWCKSRGRAAF